MDLENLAEDVSVCRPPLVISGLRPLLLFESGMRGRMAGKKGSQRASGDTNEVFPQILNLNPILFL